VALGGEDIGSGHSAEISLQRIARIDDPRIEVYRDLKRTNQTRWSNQFVVEGEKLVERLLASRFPVESVLASERYQKRLPHGISSQTPVYIAEHSLLEALVGFRFHRGILACGRRLSPAPLSELMRPDAEFVTLVACPHLADPENLGSIVRLSAAFGIDAVLVGASCPDPFSRRVLRVSMGAVLCVPIVKCDDLGAVVERLRREEGVRFAATVLADDAQPLTSALRPRRFGLVFGSEGFGLDPEWIARCDLQITIPMSHRVDSLNVAAAAAIILHHFHPPNPRGAVAP
jgi:tRNA G18 (ribose-2'-O)-methylase SpoU